MVIRLWHLLAVAALALLALGAVFALLLSGETKTTNTARNSVSAAVYAAHALRQAEADVRASLPDIEAYNADSNGYTGATAQELRKRYDASLPTSVMIVAALRTTYCVEATVDGQTASRNGPLGPVTRGPCVATSP